MKVIPLSSVEPMFFNSPLPFMSTFFWSKKVYTFPYSTNPAIHTTTSLFQKPPFTVSNFFFTINTTSLPERPKQFFKS